MLADRIEGEVAQPGAAVRRALIGDIGEQAHPAAAIDPPDAAGAAARTELARHPFGIGAAGLRAPGPALRGGDDVEAEHRGGGRIDVGSAASGAAAVVEGDAEHLADLFGLHLKSARRIDQPRVVRSIHPGEIEDDEQEPSGSMVKLSSGLPRAAEDMAVTPENPVITASPSCRIGFAGAGGSAPPPERRTQLR